MEQKPSNEAQEKIRHEGGDPASLKQDPAQAYPTGGAGLADPRNAPKQDLGGPIAPDRAEPTK